MLIFQNTVLVTCKENIEDKKTEWSPSPQVPRLCLESLKSDGDAYKTAHSLFILEKWTFLK